MVPSMRILVLNGGGSSGLATAHFLTKLEAQIGPLSSFDLIAGTSVGAILAANVACGVSASVSARTLSEALPKIFRKSPWPWAGRLTPKCRADALQAALEGMFGSYTIGGTRNRLMINALQVSPTVEPKFWKSWEGTLDTVRDVLMASAAAPTLFRPHEFGGATYLDGCLSTNDLTMCAIAEAIRLEGAMSNLRVLTVRCRNGAANPPRNASKLANPLRFAIAYPELSIGANQELAEYQAHSLLGFNAHVVDLGITSPVDTYGPEHDRECEQAAANAFHFHRQALQERFHV